MEATGFPRSRSKSLSEKAYLYIKNAIIANQFRPGEALSEELIAAKLSMSRTPIREALRKLQLEGLVQIIPNRGAFVTRLSLNDIREIFQLREVLEGAASRLAAEFISPDVLERFERKRKELELKSPSADHQEFYNFGLELHDAILKAARNRRLYNFIHSLNDQIERLRGISSLDPKRTETSFGQHCALLDALKARDGTAAEGAMVAHIVDTRNSVYLVLDREAVDSTEDVSDESGDLLRLSKGE